MDERLKALYDATENALRTAAFAFTSWGGVTVADCPLEDRLMGSRIDFSGPTSGNISLIVPERLATYLTANMTAQDDGDPSTIEKRSDSVCELLNIVCGQFLPRLRPDAEEFRIGIPRLKDGIELQADITDVGAAGVLPDGTLCLDVEVDGSPARLILAIDRPA